MVKIIHFVIHTHTHTHTHIYIHAPQLKSWKKMRVLLFFTKKHSLEYLYKFLVIAKDRNITFIKCFSYAMDLKKKQLRSSLSFPNEVTLTK